MQEKEFLIGQYINRIARMNHRWLEPRLAELGLAAAQLPVFGALKTLGPLSQKDLAAILHVEQSSMAQLLARMERDGLIERVADPQDGRSSRIHLTKLALRLSGPAQRVLDEGRKISQKQMSSRDLDILERLLGKMLASMEEALSSEQEKS
ncbi:MAG TPA: MarR family transcriptional regulator [Edaphobacter sp.]